MSTCAPSAPGSAQAAPDTGQSPHPRGHWRPLPPHASAAAPPLRRTCPSGDHERSYTSAQWPRRTENIPHVPSPCGALKPKALDLTPLSFHRMISLSSDADASVFPSGEKRTALTGYARGGRGAGRGAGEPARLRAWPRPRRGRAHPEVPAQLLMEDNVRVVSGAGADPPQPNLVVVAGRRDEPALGRVDPEHGIPPVPRDLWRRNPRHRRAERAVVLVGLLD